MFVPLSCPKVIKPNSICSKQNNIPKPKPKAQPIKEIIKPSNKNICLIMLLSAPKLFKTAISFCLSITSIVNEPTILKVAINNTKVRIR